MMPGVLNDPRLAPSAITAAVGHTYSENPNAWVEEFKRRGMALQHEANLRSGGAFEPDTDPEPVSPAALRQQRWEAIVGHLGPARTECARLSHFSGDYLSAIDGWLIGKGTTRKARRLLLSGEVSTGKTSLACAIAHEWWQNGSRPVVGVLVGDLLTTDRDLEAPGVSRLSTVDEDTLVILDDLPRSAAWGSFTNLVTRLDSIGCRIVTTTNLPLSERRDADAIDPRVRARLEPDDGLVVPLPHVLGGTLPDPPGVGPCPFHCVPPGTFVLGHLERCDWPEIASRTVDLIENEMQTPGPAPLYGLRPPSPADYVEADARDAEIYLAAAWSRWDAAFLLHETKTEHWCPHCRPEQCRPDGFLMRALRDAGRA